MTWIGSTRRFPKLLIFSGSGFYNADHGLLSRATILGSKMYVDYYPVEAIVPSVAVDDDIVEIRQAKRLTPIREILELYNPKYKLHPRCTLHKGLLDKHHAYCMHCGATYCMSCAKMLNELNEPCWSCGEPLALELVVTIIPDSVE